MNNVDYDGMKVPDLLEFEKDKIVYEYDFGDSWNHIITLEKILPYDGKTNYPMCIKGKGNCPPGDVGGTWGYAEMPEVLEQPDHEEYKNYIEWLGEDFNPACFDIDKVNEELKLL